MATANAYTTSEDMALSGNILTDGTPDSDADGDTLTVTGNTSPLNGAVTVAANGAFSYTPPADFNGSDSFTYTIGDGNGGAATATVSITVTPVNDGPVASFGSACTDLDCAFTDGSTDIDGTIVAWSWDFGDGATSAVQSPTHGYAAVDGIYTVTVAVTGEAGLGYMMGNLEVPVREKLGVTVVHVSNGGFSGYGPGFWGAVTVTSARPG